MSTFNMGEFMKFNKPHQQQIQQQTMMNHQLINQGMPSVASIWEATRAMISTQEVAQDWGKQSLREANTQPPPPQHTQHIASIMEATRAMISTQDVAQDWGKQNLREAHTQPPPPQHSQHSLSWSAQVAQQSIPGTSSSGLFNTNPAHQQPQVQSVQIQQQQQQQQHHQQQQQQQQQQTHHQQQPPRQQQEYVLLSNEFNYDCEHCSFTGTSKENLQDHMRLHAAARPHSCGICGLSFTYKQSLDKHMSNHKPEKSISCKFCPSTFSSRADYNSHIVTHAVKCGLCDTKFMNADLLKEHKKQGACQRAKKVERQVPKLLPFMCALCKIGCATTKALSKHMKEHKEGATVSPFTCQECGIGYSNRNTLQQHMLTAHKKDKTKYTAPAVIRKATVNPVTLQQSLMSKPSTTKVDKIDPWKHKPWKCARCQQGFPLPAHLKAHVKKCVSGGMEGREKVPKKKKTFNDHPVAGYY